MTFFIGVDLHKTQFTVHVRTEESSESLHQIKQYKTDEKGYTGFTTRIKAYKEIGAVVKIGVESTGNTRFFKHEVEKAAAEVTVINTLKFKIINESAKKKRINMMLLPFQSFYHSRCPKGFMPDSKSFLYSS